MISSGSKTIERAVAFGYLRAQRTDSQETGLGRGELVRSNASDVRFVCAPVIMEVEAGLTLKKALSPELRTGIDRVLKRFPAERRFVFDDAAAVSPAGVLGAARQRGRPIGIVDAQIIGLAGSTRCAVATRDGDFLDRGVEIVNPWAE